MSIGRLKVQLEQWDLPLKIIYNQMLVNKLKRVKQTPFITYILTKDSLCIG